MLSGHGPALCGLAVVRVICLFFFCAAPPSPDSAAFAKRCTNSCTAAPMLSGSGVDWAKLSILCLTLCHCPKVIGHPLTPLLCP